MGRALDALIHLYKVSVPLENTDHLGRFLTVQDMQKLATLEKEKKGQLDIQLSFDENMGGVTLLPRPDEYLDKMLGQLDRQLPSFFTVQHEDQTLRLRQTVIDLTDEYGWLYTTSFGNCMGHECLREAFALLPFNMPPDDESPEPYIHLLLAGGAHSDNLNNTCCWYGRWVLRSRQTGTLGCLIVTEPCNGCPCVAPRGSAVAPADGLYAGELAALSMLLSQQLDSRYQERQVTEYRLRGGIPDETTDRSGKPVKAFVINMTPTQIHVVEAAVSDPQKPDITFFRHEPFDLDEEGCRRVILWLFFAVKDFHLPAAGSAARRVVEEQPLPFRVKTSPSVPTGAGKWSVELPMIGRDRADTNNSDDSGHGSVSAEGGGWPRACPPSCREC